MPNKRWITYVVATIVLVAGAVWLACTSRGNADWDMELHLDKDAPRQTQPDLDEPERSEQ